MEPNLAQKEPWREPGYSSGDTIFPNSICEGCRFLLIIYALFFEAVSRMIIFLVFVQRVGAVRTVDAAFFEPVHGIINYIFELRTLGRN